MAYRGFPIQACQNSLTSREPLATILTKFSGPVYQGMQVPDRFFPFSTHGAFSPTARPVTPKRKHSVELENSSGGSESTPVTTPTPPATDSGYASDNGSVGNRLWTPPKRMKLRDASEETQLSPTQKFLPVDCEVCGEKAHGKFFGAFVCLPCKTFFIRCTTEDVTSFVCRRSDGQCEINSHTRSRCKYCRYQRCLKIGMVRRERPEKVDVSDGQLLCAVCSDVANGVHFGVVSCEGCKKFFRRGLREYESYHCRFTSSCVINPRTRNECRFCRFQSCLRAGMSRCAIRMGRPRKDSAESRRQSRHASSPPSSTGSDTPMPGLLHLKQPGCLPTPYLLQARLSASNEQLVNPWQTEEAGSEPRRRDGDQRPGRINSPTADPGCAILVLYESFLCRFYRSIDLHETFDNSVARLAQARLRSHICSVVHFAREIPGFGDFCDEDQFQILHECTVQICLILISTRDSTSPRNSFLDVSYPQGHPLIDFQMKLQKFSAELSALQLKKEEQFFLCILVFTSVDDSKIQNKTILEEMRGRVNQVVFSHLASNCPNPLERRHVIHSILPKLKYLGQEYYRLSLRITVD